MARAHAARRTGVCAHGGYSQEVKVTGGYMSRQAQGSGVYMVRGIYAVRRRVMSRGCFSKPARRGLSRMRRLRARYTFFHARALVVTERREEARGKNVNQLS